MRLRRVFSLACIVLLICCNTMMAAGKQVTLRFATWQTGPEVKAVIDRFMELNPEIKVEYEVVTGAYDDKMLVQLASGVAPDVFMLQDEPFPAYARTGALLDLNPIVQRYNIPLRDFVPQTLDYFYYHKGLYAMPTSGGAGLIIHNTGMFDNSGLPRPAEKGWDYVGFMNSMRKLTKDTDGNGTPEIYAAQDMRSWLYAMPWMWMFGGKFIEVSLPDREIAVARTDSQEAIAMFEWMQKLRSEWNIMPPVTAKGIGFRAGTSATWQWSEGPWLTTDLRNLETQGFTWDVAHMPKGPKGFQAARQSYDGVAINAATKIPDEAGKLIAYLMSIEGQKNFAALSLPARITAAMSPQFLKPETPQHEHYFVEAMAEYAWMQPTNLHWAQAQATVTRWFNLLRDGQTSPLEMGRSLRQELNGIFMETWPATWRDYYRAHDTLPPEADGAFLADRRLRSAEENAKRKSQK